MTRALRVLGTLVLVLLVFRLRGTVAEAFQVLAQGDWLLWCIAALLQLASLWVSSLRLGWLLRRLDASASTAGLFADVIRATALNAALLMGVGDAYRVRYINERLDNLALSGGAVVFDRLLGLATVCALAGLGILWLGPSRFELELPAIAIVLAVVAALVAVALHQRFLPLPRRLLADLRPLFDVLAERPSHLAVLLLLSVGVVICWISSVAVLTLALGISVPLGVVAFAAPLVTMATLLPISIGGIGVREAGYALLLSPDGVTSAQGIALGTAQYSLLLPIMAAGAVMLLLVRTRIEREA